MKAGICSSGNNRESEWMAITKFNWLLGRYDPSSPSTKGLHGLGIFSPSEKMYIGR